MTKTKEYLIELKKTGIKVLEDKEVPKLKWKGKPVKFLAFFPDNGIIIFRSSDNKFKEFVKEFIKNRYKNDEYDVRFIHDGGCIAEVFKPSDLL